MLLQVIEGLVEPIYQLRVGGVNKSGGLDAVDHLNEGAIEGALGMQLMHIPSLGEGLSQNGADDCGLHHGAKSSIVVHTGALGEPLKDPTRLVPVQRTIRVEPMLEDPLVSYHIGSRWSWY
jgi:hypothetical protein